MTQFNAYQEPVAHTLNNLAVALNTAEFAQTLTLPIVTPVQLSLLNRCQPCAHLIIYGSLAPGKVNHGQVAHINGTYEGGVIHGVLVKAGWGEHLGFPGFRWKADSQGDFIPVQILYAQDMGSHWLALDAFEGKAYHRMIIPYLRDSGVWGLGCVYALCGVEK